MRKMAEIFKDYGSDSTTKCFERRAWRDHVTDKKFNWHVTVANARRPSRVLPISVASFASRLFLFLYPLRQVRR